MNWRDIGGRTKVQHVVVKWNYGINVSILCQHFIVNHARVKETHRQLPHCQQCIDVLKKLIQESIIKHEFKAPKNFVSPLTGRTYS